MSIVERNGEGRCGENKFYSPHFYFDPHTTFTLSLTAKSSEVMSRLLTVLAFLFPYPHRQLDLLLGVFFGGDAAVEKLRQNHHLTAPKSGPDAK